MRWFAFLLPLFLVVELAPGQIRLNEVDPAAKWFEVHNAGSEAVNVSSLWACVFPAYAQLSTLNRPVGSLTIPAGGFSVFEFGSIRSPNSELGLYTSAVFSSANSMLDYMEFGGSGFTRESVAVSAGLWVAGETVMLPNSGETLGYFGGAVGAASWGSATPTPGNPNQPAGGTATSLEQPDDGVVLTAPYPNPTKQDATLVLRVSRAQNVSVTVYDVTGRSRAVSFSGNLGPGSSTEISLGLTDAVPGLYIWQAVGEDFFRTGTTLVIR